MIDLKAPHRTGIVFFPAFDWSISPTHPEREERLLYTRDQIFEEGLLDIEGIEEFAPEVATHQDVERVHTCFPSSAALASTSHLISAGGAITAARKVMEGEVERAFALVRPPGHHARRVVQGLRGFCVINIEAVMIEYLRRYFRDLRVAIVDTDCHHGDGTQDIYWHDPDTLFISIHQDGRTLYPGTGFPDELGGPNAMGSTINVPLPPGTTDEGVLYALDHLVLPILEDWKPDLIVNSAGQDNHFTDPITDMAVTAQGYAAITRKLKAHIAVLEGGYSVQSALPYVNTGILLAMAGLDSSRVIEPDYRPDRFHQSQRTKEYVARICEIMLDKYKRRDELREQAFRGLSHHRDVRQVYYDGDGITENQTERVRICSECGGVVVLESAVAGRGKVLTIELPRRCCPACRTEGEEAYNGADARQFAVIELHDRPADAVLRRER
ncbi:MAG: histone deacetylase [Deltaproteobacteria bacterium]|nr:histone deacetylase [Deltaproteobacteria bacterium]